MKLKYINVASLKSQGITFEQNQEYDLNDSVASTLLKDFSKWFEVISQPVKEVKEVVKEPTQEIKPETKPQTRSTKK